MAEERSFITLGGKESSLSSSSVYKVSSGVANVRIDSSAIERISTRNTPSIKRNSFGFPEGLTSEETRASLAVLAKKLILSTSGAPSSSTARSVLPVKIVDILNSKDECLELGEIDVTEGENVVLEESCASLIGICSIIDHKSSTLSKIVASIAALSCEVSKADIASFSSLDSGDVGFGVAGDLKVLLNGYKGVGKLEIKEISKIPGIHGIFRSVVKSLNADARRELNSGVTGSGYTVISEALGTTLLALSAAIKNIGVGSFLRAKLCFESIGNENLILSNGLSEVIAMSCVECEHLKNSYKLAFNAHLDEDYCRCAQELNVSLGIVWKLVGLEAVVAFFALAGGELLAQKSRDAVKEEAKTDKKKKKNEKKTVLGKGTSVVIQFIKDRLVSTETASDNDKKNSLNKWVERIKNLINPESHDFETFLGKVKEIVESNENRRLPKLPKGTRDFAKEQMAVRKKAFSIVRNVFEGHGGTELDTPVFELRETLMRDLYGEDAKLVYDLADQGGELCCLRYDLTVPFARYVAMNGLPSFRRYQIAKVYRRDKPAKGRSREFYQCDFDIAGSFEPMGPDFEVVKTLTELIDELEIGDYQVKLSHRKLLDGILEICHVPSDKIRTICSSIDKLDKQSFEQVKKEMVEEKGLSSEIADRIGEYVKEKGAPFELLSKLKQEERFLSNKSSREALDELSILFEALEKSKCSHRIVFDLSLARGLDYYTGVIFEAVCIGAEVGSIGAGGRYDNLIGKFGTKQVPAVGMSLGIERVFNIMEERNEKQKKVIRPTETQVLVSIMVDNKLPEAAELVSKLWDAKIKAEYLVGKRQTKHFDHAKESGIPWMVMVGEKELAKGVVTLKNLVNGRCVEEIKDVSRDSFVAELLKRDKDMIGNLRSKKNEKEETSVVKAKAQRMAWVLKTFYFLKNLLGLTRGF